MNHIRNVRFIVEGKTEGQANAFGKGIQNILRDECRFMRDRDIKHKVIRKFVKMVNTTY